jgi:hypothetical protein
MTLDEFEVEMAANGPPAVWHWLRSMSEADREEMGMYFRSFELRALRAALGSLHAGDEADAPLEQFSIIREQTRREADRPDEAEDATVDETAERRPKQLFDNDGEAQETPPRARSAFEDRLEKLGCSDALTEILERADAGEDFKTVQAEVLDRFRAEHNMRPRSQEMKDRGPR